MKKNTRIINSGFIDSLPLYVAVLVTSFVTVAASADDTLHETGILGQGSNDSIITVGDIPDVAESAGRGEHRLLIHYRKRYLDDVAIDYYLSGADLANEISIGKSTAFYYLDYSVRREFAATIHPGLIDERLFFEEETRIIGEEYASWARGQLNYNYMDYEEEILLLLLAEIKYDQEYSRYVDLLGNFNTDMSRYQSGDGNRPRPPRLDYSGSVSRLELIIVGYPVSPAALYAWYFLGCLLGDLGDWKSSEFCFIKALGFEGDNPYRDESALRLASIVLEYRRYEEAEEYYKSVADNSGFLTDALYGLTYINYVLAGVEDNRKRDEEVLGYFGELYSISRNDLITEYCANLAVASLLSLNGYSDLPAPDDIISAIEKYAKYINNPDAEVYLISRMGGDY